MQWTLTIFVPVNADKWTYIGLATDIACAALPGVTGGRLGVQALEETVTHTDNVGDLFKLLDKTADAYISLDKNPDITNAILNRFHYLRLPRRTVRSFQYLKNLTLELPAVVSKIDVLKIPGSRNNFRIGH
ncbi:hypothetical protein ACSAZL_08310 [Methanosarcina sp. T3]|uniref:hypothetical protein n=1 Tax=Methanosarcina sp. T3 TaxID=3439062 RepID=UPI003F878E9F